jgi:hypothetical protein
MSSRRKGGSASNDLCLIVLTVLVVVSLFFFVLVISHDTLGLETVEQRVPVVNNVVKWTVSVSLLPDAFCAWNH